MQRCSGSQLLAIDLPGSCVLRNEYNRLAQEAVIYCVLSMICMPAIKLVLSTGGSWAKSPIKSTPAPPKGPISTGGAQRKRLRHKTAYRRQLID